MSNYDENGSERTICRDYLNKICTRGARCKYYHPPGDEYGDASSGGGNAAGGADNVMSAANGAERENLKFCEDFATGGGCFRQLCSFVHCSKEAATDYQRTGRMRQDLAQGVFGCDPTRQDLGGKPLCKEFMNNSCRRGDRCKFWHIIANQERTIRYAQGASAATTNTTNAPMMSGGAARNGAASNMGNFISYPIDYGATRDFDYPAESVKRTKIAPEMYGGSGYENYNINPYMMAQQQMGIQTGSAAILRTENSDLMRTCEMLQKTVDDLRASNDSLLSENARLRERWNVRM